MAGLIRIIIHWTAGGPKASIEDKSHYHFLYEQSGRVIRGDQPPEENIRTNDHIYAPHTLSLNTGSIGVSFCAMALAQPFPLFVGSYPLTDPQLEAGLVHIGQLCRRYSIPVTRRTVLTHAEVQPTLGIKQKGKWDIRWLPGMTAIGDAVEIGDQLRARIRP
ncbi:MAG: N-acetylmuramoyl-L-alanine amidase [Cereibacter sphaeroides]|uniref:N-acetylmuramoyl-L-alanine amidase n=1 Tax=Cereibacter sphaeroides TaxID=1063 RepID=A0A2W5TV44_CERSP|nr:MAG: N-acetylmuramoyl-L-alanine amidase [Cereibacter sphaeroides]